MIESIEWLVGVVSGAVSGLFAYFIGRRKTNAEATNTELEAVQKAVGIWRETAEALQEDVNILRGEIDSLRSEIATLKGLNDRLQRQVVELTHQNAELKKLIQP